MPKTIHIDPAKQSAPEPQKSPIGWRNLYFHRDGSNQWADDIHPTQLTATLTGELWFAQGCRAAAINPDIVTPWNGGDALFTDVLYFIAMPICG